MRSSGTSPMHTGDRQSPGDRRKRPWSLPLAVSVLLVSTMPAGGVMRLTNWRRSVFLSARRRAGLSDRFRVHDLRHTAASLVIQAGYPPKMLQEIMGHASITTTPGPVRAPVPGRDGPLRRPPQRGCEYVRFACSRPLYGASWSSTIQICPGSLLANPLARSIFERGSGRWATGHSLGPSRASR
jgi:Phage integrase family